MSGHVGPNVVTDGLILCLDSFNHLSLQGDTWRDVSGSGVEGTISGPSSIYDGGKRFLDFTGGVGHVRLVRDDLNGGSFAYREATFEMWYRHRAGRTGITANNILTIENTFEISCGDVGGGKAALNYASQPWSWRGRSKPVMPVEQWVQITYVHRTTGRWIYVDGDEVFYSDNTGALSSGTSKYPYLTLMARYTGTSSRTSGDISYVNIYNRPLEEVEIKHNYRALRDRFLG